MFPVMLSDKSKLVYNICDYRSKIFLNFFFLSETVEKKYSFTSHIKHTRLQRLYNDILFK